MLNLGFLTGNSNNASQLIPVSLTWGDLGMPLP